jgi:hypothetical protein
MATVHLPTESPVVTALRDLAFPGEALIPSTRPVSSESWVAYLARCVRQRRCREAPPIVTGDPKTPFVDAAGRLLACGEKIAPGHADAVDVGSDPVPVAAMSDVHLRSVAARSYHIHILALDQDGRVYS